jgi:DNA-binding winged helix-turn-helix (wHTH) protein/tetratricopeptide (TPR) repeat protein
MQGDFYLGDSLVQPALGRLTVDGRTFPVRAKVMDLLGYFAGHPGEVISKDRLLDDVWGSQAISESALTRTVTELRQALGDNAEAPRILETIPKRGYRLVAPVTPCPVSSTTPPTASPHQVRTHFPAIFGVATVGVLVLVLGAWLWGTNSGSATRALKTGQGEASSLPFAARDWVLVAAFENRTGEPVFDDVLEQALNRELVGSGFVNLAPRPRVEDVLALMKKPADQRLDASVAREVALRDGGIRAVLTGSIRNVGGAYALTTEIVNPIDGRVMANITADVQAPGDLLERVRAQALRVRQTLGEALPSIERAQVALQKVTTPSLQALQLYSRAAALLEGDVWRWRAEAMGRYRSAEALLRKSTDADPLFASAWLVLAHAVRQQDRPRSEYLPLAERAMALSGTVSSPERYLIEGFTHTSRWDGSVANRRELDVAARAYEALLQLTPDHYWALLELVETYRDLGRFEEADRVTLQAARVRPHSPRFAADSAKIHINHGDLTSARTIITRMLTGAEGAEDRAVDAYDSLEWARLWEAHEAWLNHDVKRALAVARAAEQKWIASTSLVWHAKLQALYTGLGTFEDAVRVANRIEPVERRDWFLAYIALNHGRMQELRQMLRPERENFELLHNRFGMLVRAGWVGRAEWVERERVRRKVSLPWYIKADQEGQLRAAEGRYAEAIALMEPLKSVPGTRFYVDDAMAVSLRGVGDLPAAILKLERVSDSRARAVTYDGWQVYAWLRCRVRLAEFYREAGRQADADRVFAEVRTLLSVAEADHPLWPRVSTQ